MVKSGQNSQSVGGRPLGFPLKMSRFCLKSIPKVDWRKVLPGHHHQDVCEHVVSRAEIMNTFR